jgi:diguanylate cyclase (GGDEF)-like protein/PAS domain S-box-containing protein
MTLAPGGPAPEWAAFEQRRLAVRSALVCHLVGSVTTAATALSSVWTPVQRGLLLGVALLALASGIGILFLPWQRWPREALLSLLPLALVMVAVVNYAHPEPYTASIFVFVIAVWLGVTQRPFIPLALCPLLALDFWLPLRLADHAPPLDVAVPLVVVAAAAVGETVAWLIRRLSRVSGAVRALMETRFAAISGVASDVTVLLDRELTISYVSASALRILGVPASRLVGRPSRTAFGDRFIHPEDRSRAGELIAELPEPGAPRSAEIRIRYGDGKWHWSECVSNNLEGDPMLSGHLVSIRDIGPRKETEERLRASERSFRMMFEHSPLPMWVHEKTNLRIVRVNESACRLYGLPQERFLTRTVLDVVHPSDRASLRERLAGIGYGYQRPGVDRHLTGDGRTINVDLAAQGIELDGRECCLVLLNDITDQLRLETRLRHQAFHDALTGLANRALLQDRLDHALQAHSRSGGHAALVICDLDGFKTINDSLGHHAGDELLTVAARRLLELVRPGDTVARLGGDEFAVLLPELEEPEVARRVAERVVEALGQPFPLDSQTVLVSASVGVTFSHPGKSAVELLREADAAMYEAKSAGKNRIRVFERDMHERAVDRLQLVNAMPSALERGEFFLEYQPHVRISDARVEGCEALLRWRHPDRGLIPPGAFIGLAEETGFIVPLGRWILETACTTAAGWTGLPGAPPSVSVNISPRQVLTSGLLDDVRGVLARTGLPATRLTLEITESVLMNDSDRAGDVLVALRALGVRLALDDFGVGYSSLGYLRRFPIDILKIDKSFIDATKDGGDHALVSSIIGLGRTLGLHTVAEGVEVFEQYGRLAELGCDSAQGFLMSRPVPAPTAATLVAGGFLDPSTATEAPRPRRERAAS